MFGVYEIESEYSSHFIWNKPSDLSIYSSYRVIGYFNERFQGEWLAMPRVTVSILSFFNFSILTCAAGKKVVNER